MNNVKTSKTYEMDMCNGPLLSKIVVFAIPLMLSGILQLLFNAADIVVVGRFAGKESLAAVGSTTSLINLLLNAFMGLSIGVNVLVARYYGSQEWEKLDETVHTSVVLGAVCGLFLTVLGETVSERMLTLMGTPEDVLPLSALYLKIYFLGMPATLLYNFGSAVLRAAGDTKRPLYFLFFSGAVNVILNLFFVIVFSAGVVGVALATIISQSISAGLIIYCLMKTDAAYKIIPWKLRLIPARAVEITKVGLPAGLQSAIFSLSNVVIQSSLNSFGSIAMAGSTAAANIEGFVHTSANACYQTSLSFTSQNYGARNYKRMRKIMIYSMGLVMVVCAVMGGGAVLMGKQLLGIYSSDPEVIQYGMHRLTINCGMYVLCGWMITIVGGIRGAGYSVLPMVVALAGGCGVRMIWIFTYFAGNRTLDNLYLSYPLSWAVTLAAHAVCYFVIRRKMEKSEI